MRSKFAEWMTTTVAPKSTRRCIVSALTAATAITIALAGAFGLVNDPRR